MKYALTLATALTTTLWGGTALATPVDAVSYLQVSHSYEIVGGDAPDFIDVGTGGPNPTRIRNSGVDDPAAALAIDDVATQVGVVGDIPYRETARHRTNRPDPTEFADAQYDISLFATQDAGSTFLGFGSETIERTGLAQTRITSDPVAAFAQSGYSDERRSRITNESDGEETLAIRGEFAFSLLSSVNGDDALARTSTAIDLVLSGVDAADVTFLSLETYAPDIEDSAPGATVVENLIRNEPGTAGLTFSAATTAIGDGGYTEATLDVTFRYLLFVTLGAGETVFLDFGYSQANYVEYTPGMAAVPLPAGLPLLAGALALLGLAGRRRGAAKGGLS